MPIQKGREKEYKALEKAMIEKGLSSSVRLARWFFNLIDLGRLDIKSIIFTFCHTAELYEMFGIEESEMWRIFFSIKAIIVFHDKGEEFRNAWNSYWLKDDWERVESLKENEKYVINPYMKK